jgi:pimeloyl-ACP methyl ester carboxylesterase
VSRELLIGSPDGRTLEAVEEGDPDGTLVVFHHGSPGAAVPFEPFGRAAAERGIRLVTISRAGFGASTRHSGRIVADAAADAAALADHLGAERFLTMGWSGGGPHALACAALLPDRVRAAATIAGVAPYDAQGLDWTAGMGEDNQIEYPLAARDPGRVAPLDAAARGGSRRRGAERDRVRAPERDLRGRRGRGDR